MSGLPEVISAVWVCGFTLDKIGLDNVLKEVEYLTENNSISNLSEILSQEKNNIYHLTLIYNKLDTLIFSLSSSKVIFSATSEL